MTVLDASETCKKLQQKNFKNIQKSKITKMIGDNSANNATNGGGGGDGDSAWTKLLDDKDGGNSAVIVKMGKPAVSEPARRPSDAQLTGASPLTIALLAATPEDAHNGDTDTTVTVASTLTGGDVVVAGGLDGATTADNCGAEKSRSGSVGDTSPLARKESILGTFHRHLRRSIKAVSESPGPITRYRQTRFSSRRVRKRVIFKHGDCNVVQGNVAKRRRRYLQDIFTTLVDAQWRWTLLVFALSFLISWAFFGFIWWTIAYAHGDLEYIYKEDFAPHLVANVTHTMCVTQVRSLTSAFLFSIETQHTIGYGNRFVTEECPEAIFTMCLQCITGVFIQAFMVGIVFAKLSRPKKRAQTLLFSRNAVLCHRDGVPCLMFRVGDMRKSHIIEAHVRAQIIRKKVTKEGEILPFFQQELTVGADGGEDRLMFIWPTTIVHKINKNSPLYMLSASDMLKERFEVVVMLEGVIESTGMTTQARSSYLPSEILWGHRFVNVVSFRKESGEYEVDYTLFNNTYDVDTPLCSAKQLDEVKAEYAKSTKSGLERALSAGLIHAHAASASSVPSVDHFDPASDESLDSGRLQIRSNSIPNGVLPEELQPLNNNNNNNNNSNNINNNSTTFTVGGSLIPPPSPSPVSVSPSTPTITFAANIQSINEKLGGPPTNGNTSNTANSNNNNNGSSNGGHSNNSNSSSSTSNLKKSSLSSSASGGGRRLSIKQDQLPIDSIC